MMVNGKRLETHGIRLKIKKERSKGILVKTNEIYQNLVKEIYESTEIIPNVFDLELSYKSKVAVKMRPVSIKNDKDVIVFILEKNQNIEYQVPLCVMLVKEKKTKGGNNKADGEEKTSSLIIMMMTMTTTTMRTMVRMVMTMTTTMMMRRMVIVMMIMIVMSMRMKITTSKSSVTMMMHIFILSTLLI